MTSTPHSLAQIQRWMQAVITHPDGVFAGVHRPAAQSEYPIAPHEIESLIEPSSRLNGAERLSVYATAYFARLLECLRDEFPAVCTALGEDAFNGLGLSYLSAHSSTSYTLGELGCGFADHLEQTRPPRATSGSGETGPDWADFLIDLARLERTYAEVFDGPGIENARSLSAEDLATLDPRDWTSSRLQTAPCLRLLRMRFPVHEYATAVRSGKTQVAFPSPRPCHLIISRRDYIVRRVCVAQLEFELLEALHEGQCIGEALSSCVSSSDLDDHSLATHLHDWFHTWSRSGYFVGLHRAAPENR